MSFTATLEIKCWKEHTCSCCGTVYRYLFTRKKQGQGATEDKAAEAANNAVVKALADEVEMRACPGCGHYQPEMIGEKRRGGLWVVFWAALLLMAVPIVLGALGLKENVMLYILAAIGVAAGVAMFLIAGGKPNRNTEANKEKTLDYVEDGTLKVVENRNDRGEPVSDAKGTGFVIAFALLLVGLLIMLAAEWVRMARGWPVNPRWGPVVAGPGDSPWTWFDQHVDAVKGYWNGNGDAVITNAKELGIANARLNITSRQDNWGNSISVKSNEKNSTPKLWARVHLPNDPNLAGKTVNLAFTLHVTFPTMMGDKQFGNMSRTFNYNTQIALASPGAGGLWTGLWWLGAIGGTLLVLLTNIFLIVQAKSFRDTGMETRVVPIRPLTRSPSDEPDEDEEPRPKRRPARDEED